jgi:TRAP-type C4-dicarboxylate transport system substrate-binding protein
VNVLMARKKWLSEQPSATQQAVREAGRRAQTEQIRLWDQESALALDRAKSQHAVINDVDVAAFRRTLAPVLQEHRGTFGDLAALLPDA